MCRLEIFRFAIYSLKIYGLERYRMSLFMPRLGFKDSHNSEKATNGDTLEMAQKLILAMNLILCLLRSHENR